MRLFFLALLGLWLSFVYQFWFGNNGLIEYRQAARGVMIQRLHNQELEERNALMRRQVDDLRHGLEGVEERARNDLGMIRKGETFYRILPDNESK